MLIFQFLKYNAIVFCSTIICCHHMSAQHSHIVADVFVKHGLTGVFEAPGQDYTYVKNSWYLCCDCDVIVGDLIVGYTVKYYIELMIRPK